VFREPGCLAEWRELSSISASQSCPSRPTSSRCRAEGCGLARSSTQPLATGDDTANAGKGLLCFLRPSHTSSAGEPGPGAGPMPRIRSAGGQQVWVRRAVSNFLSGGARPVCRAGRGLSGYVRGTPPVSTPLKFTEVGGGRCSALPIHEVQAEVRRNGRRLVAARGTRLRHWPAVAAMLAHVTGKR